MAKRDLARRLVEDTRVILETGGWCQGSYFSGKQHCLLGALQLARQRMRPQLGWRRRTAPELDGAFDEALAVVQDVIGDNIVGWNDDDDRTQEDVQLALKEAGERLEVGS